MRRKLLPLALFIAALTGGVIKAHGQTDLKPRYFRLDITITGKASCFWDGSDCKVG